MKRLRTIVILPVLVAVLATGCNSYKLKQNSYETELIGQWAYAHDLTSMQAQFTENGDAVFEGNNFTFTSDGEFITLKSTNDGKKDTVGNNHDLTLRYVQKDDQMYVYVQGTYERTYGNTDDGIVGVWMCHDKKWSFEFTDKGTFMEDGALTGYYEVNEDNGTVKLMYGEALEDTIFYYQLSEDTLFIEYPWLMERME